MFVEVHYLLKLSIDRTIVDDLCILETKIFIKLNNSCQRLDMYFFVSDSLEREV